MSSNLKKLGAEVLARREHLGLTQDEVADAGGPSNTTQSKIENQLVEVVSRATLKRLDAGLQWEAGSARRIYEAGADPTPIADADEPTRSVSAERDDDDTLLYRRPEGLTNEQWREIKARNRKLVEWEIEQALQQGRS